MNFNITKGKVLNKDGSYTQFDEIYIRNGQWVSEVKSEDSFEKLEGVCLFPQLTELFADFKEPGREHIYTLEDGVAAMKKGGFGRVLLTPDTIPVIDKAADVESLLQKTREFDAKLLIAGGISINLEGKRLPEMLEMAKQGAVAFSNGLMALPSNKYLRSVMKYATQLDKRLHLFPLEKDFDQSFYFPEGTLADQFGLKGLPLISEEIAVYRILQIAKQTGATVHLMHLCSKESLILVKKFQELGVNVTCDVALSALLYSEKDLKELSSVYHMSPPVRNLGEDRSFIIQCIQAGLVNTLSAQHIPVLPEFKNTVYEASDPGIVQLEIAVSVVNSFLSEIPLEKFILLMTQGADQVLGVETLWPERDSNVPFFLFDPELEWSPSHDTFQGNVCNSPHLKDKLKGKVLFSS